MSTPITRKGPAGLSTKADTNLPGVSTSSGVLTSLSGQRLAITTFLSFSWCRGASSSPPSVWFQVPPRWSHQASVSKATSRAKERRCFECLAPRRCRRTFPPDIQVPILILRSWDHATTSRLEADNGVDAGGADHENALNFADDGATGKPLALALQPRVFLRTRLFESGKVRNVLRKFSPFRVIYP